MTNRQAQRIVRPSENILNEGTQVGYDREMSARRKKRNHNHGLKLTPEESLALHERGARCENVVRVAFGLPRSAWYSFEENFDRTRADLLDFIDVKSVRRRDWAMRVQCKQLKRNWAYVHVHEAPGGIYHLIGWLWGFEVEDGPLVKRCPDRPPAYEPDGLYRDLDILADFAKYKLNGKDNDKSLEYLATAPRPSDEIQI